MNEQYQIAEYSQTAAALSILRKKYSGPFDVTSSKGMSAAREARAEVRSYRVTLEKLRVEIKAPALERTRLSDAEGKRITADLLANAEPIDAAIKAEETRKAEERAAKERAETARVAAIAARISGIRNRVADVANQPAEVIRAAIDQAQTLELTEAEFSEFLPNALEALAETQAALQTALENRIAYEAEEARLKAEREELARLRQQDEERKAEQRRIEAEAKAKADAEAAAIRKAQEEEAARIAKAQQELDKRQRRIEEEEQRQQQEAEAKAKAKNGRGKKAVVNPLQELESAISAGMPVSEALKTAYEIGYQAGLNSAKQAA